MTPVHPATQLWQKTALQRHKGLILRSIAICLLATTTLAIIAIPALGQTSWSGANSADWSDAGNWDSGVPTAGDVTTVETNTPHGPQLDGIVGNTGAVRIGTGTGNGALQILNGGTLNSGALNLGLDVGSIGNLLISGAGTALTSSSGMTAGVTGESAVAISGGATAAMTYLVAGQALGSKGTITVSDTGTLLTTSLGIAIGQNGEGGLLVHNGALLEASQISIGQASSGVGTIAVSGSGSTLAALGNLVVGEDGSGTLTVWDGGIAASAATIQIAQHATSTGTINIGSALGQTARAAGTLSATGPIQFGAGNGTLNFNHTDTAYSLIRQIQGNGTINHVSGATTLTADSQGFTGTTNVTGGKLIIVDKLGGTLNVSGSGSVGGTGRLGTIAVGAGGTVAPGNSIGTVLATNVTFNAGSFYDVEVDSAGQSDLIIANTATLNGGTVRVSASPDYLVGNSYNIIHASMGLTGTFTNATTNLAFITPLLSYDGQNAFVMLFQSSNFVVAAETPNQQAVAKALDTLATNNPVVQSMLTLTVPGARQALDNLSGEAHASVRSVLLEKSRLPREAAFDRLAHDEEGMWALVEASHVSLASDGNAAAVGVGGFDLAAGADAYLGEWLAGLLVHGGTAGLSIPDRSTTGTINTIGLGAYAGTEWGATALDLGLDMALHGISTQRTFDMGRRFSATLTGNSGATTAQAFGRLSHDFVLPAFVLRPYGEGAYVATTSGGFTEAGGPAALNVAKGVSAALFTTLGLDIERELVLEDGSTLSFGGGLGWRRAFADAPKSTHAFASGDNFAVAGAPLATDALVLEAGLGWETVKEMQLDLNYDGILSNAGQSHVFKATLAGQY